MQWLEGGNFEILRAGAYTATQNSSLFKSRGYRGLWLFVSQTANPNNAETITPAIQIYDDLNNAYKTITAFTAVASSGGTGSLVYCIYPGAVITSAVSNVQCQALPISREFRVVTQLSASGSWTIGVTGLWIP
jgi:hypothetical protein